MKCSGFHARRGKENANRKFRTGTTMPNSEFGIRGVWRMIAVWRPSNPHQYPMGPDAQPSPWASDGPGPYPVVGTPSSELVNQSLNLIKPSLGLIDPSSDLIKPGSELAKQSLDSINSSSGLVKPNSDPVNPSSELARSNSDPIDRSRTRQKPSPVWRGRHVGQRHSPRCHISVGPCGPQSGRRFVTTGNFQTPSKTL